MGVADLGEPFLAGKDITVQVGRRDHGGRLEAHVVAQAHGPHTGHLGGCGEDGCEQLLTLFLHSSYQRGVIMQRIGQAGITHEREQYLHLSHRVARHDDLHPLR